MSEFCKVCGHHCFQGLCGVCELATLRTRALAAEAKLVEAREVLRSVEHVALPGMPFRRCPACLSPLDLSQPHEDDCRLRAVLGDGT